MGTSQPAEFSNPNAQFEAFLQSLGVLNEEIGSENLTRGTWKSQSRANMAITIVVNPDRHKAWIEAFSKVPDAPEKKELPTDVKKVARDEFDKAIKNDEIAFVVSTGTKQDKRRTVYAGKKMHEAITKGTLVLKGKKGTAKKIDAVQMLSEQDLQSLSLAFMKNLTTKTPTKSAPNLREATTTALIDQAAPKAKMPLPTAKPEVTAPKKAATQEEVNKPTKRDEIKKAEKEAVASKRESEAEKEVLQHAVERQEEITQIADTKQETTTAEVKASDPLASFEPQTKKKQAP